MLIIRGIVLCCCAWSEYDPYLRAGLALHTWKSSIKQEQSAQTTQPETTTQPEHPLEQENNANGIPNELAASLSRVCNPMCWGYAMRLYCEKALIEADKKNNWSLSSNELKTFAENCPMRSWKLLKPESFISYIPHNQFWNYPELYKEALLSLSSSAQANQNAHDAGNDDHKTQIEMFLKQTAHDFCQQYVQVDSFWSKKQVWAADPKKTQYFVDTWRTRLEQCGDTGLQKSYDNYMDIVISEMQDANENANRHLRERTRLRKRLFILPIATALVSAVTAAVTEMFDSNQLPVLLKVALVVITLIGAALTAWQAVMQEYGKEAEETWLRQKVCFAKLQSETQEFCDSIESYEPQQLENAESTTLAPESESVPAPAPTPASSAATPEQQLAAKQIRTYIKNIEKIRKTDWKKFFDNMNCGNDVDF